ncbi:hypothetical protein [Marivirga arenosa]|uniref:Uncharacterized protein n=1 Tax=Marivirga arenosa TaxID=3059076 RepID=A0AA51ZVK8_9BACT|nr:hypothetical protein [Marivirga sp. BKB1-2]WNB17548.1 hypothetical protein QYS47_34245 [Marivirga sp. BKB1-2]
MNWLNYLSGWNKDFNMSFIKGENGQLRIGRILVISIIAVFTIWATTFIVLYFAQEPGQVGDSFGMVNALFSALAFSLLIYTSLLQTQELRLQREELRENRKQLESSAKAHNEMVRLNKIIHADKILPQFKIIDFEKSVRGYLFSLKVMIGPISFKDINVSNSRAYSVNGVTNSRLLEEDAVLGPISFQIDSLSEDDNISIIYTDSEQVRYHQQVFRQENNWSLGKPEVVPTYSGPLIKFASPKRSRS